LAIRWALVLLAVADVILEAAAIRGKQRSRRDAPRPPSRICRGSGGRRMRLGTVASGTPPTIALEKRLLAESICNPFCIPQAVRLERLEVLLDK
jgi:hypothetical protein